MKIFKYELNNRTMNTVWLPVRAKVLSVHNQGNTLVMYAEVDPVQEPYPRRFRLYSTGEELDDISQEYIGTVLLNEGSFVVHVYEVF